MVLPLTLMVGFCHKTLGLQSVLIFVYCCCKM